MIKSVMTTHQSFKFAYYVVRVNDSGIVGLMAAERKQPANHQAVAFDRLALPGTGLSGRAFVEHRPRIPESPWYFPAKIDVSEVEAPLTRLSWEMALIVVLPSESGHDADSQDSSSVTPPACDEGVSEASSWSELALEMLPRSAAVETSTPSSGGPAT
jgi:hypothetical protein